MSLRRLVQSGQRSCRRHRIRVRRDGLGLLIVFDIAGERVDGLQEGAD